MNKDSISANVAQAKTGVAYTVTASVNGVRLSASYKGMARGGNHGKRGRVVGFSKASARRLRHLLFGLDYSGAVAVTLTHPIWGTDVMRGPEASFEALQVALYRASWLRALVWRKEVQRNGTPHYHTILWPGDGVSADEAAERLLSAWIDSCLDGFGNGDSKSALFVGMVRRDMQVAHHDKKRPAVRVMDGSCYVRYILDHESKHKQEQANTSGRPWGVWHKSKLPAAPLAGAVAVLEDWQYWAIARIMRRVTRYSLKASCVFGWRHSRGRRAHGCGDVDFFARSCDGKLGAQVLDYVRNLPPPVVRPAPTVDEMYTDTPSPRQLAALVLEDISACRAWRV